jgi:co-chaperonin GroES (HSP10)
MKNKYTPYGNKIIIKHLEEKSSIAIPSSVGKEEQALGEIIAAPKDCGLKVGDVIVYWEFAGNYLPSEKDLLVIDIQDVLAIKK